MKNRTLLSYIRKKSASKFGRIIVLTGARQTGKTTLARMAFSDYHYISLDDPVMRPDFTALSAVQWRREYPLAVVDEVQKAPQLIETIKAVYDEHATTRYVLLGSSQILLLEKVRESLAGRATLVELFPLTVPEMNTRSWDDVIAESRMVRWLRGEMKDLTCFDGVPRRSDAYAGSERFFADYVEFGAMPAIVDASLTAEDKREWLADYIQTYIQRDIRDLANLRALEPFVRAQKTLAGMTGQLLNVAHLAQLAGISPKTARRFITYLEISYQVVLLKPWFANMNKRLSKAPKVHFLDPGIQRALLGRRGQLTGAEFESAVIAEIIKQIRNSRLNIDWYHLRTVDGREIDLLLETDHGFVAIEIKLSDRVTSREIRHLRHIADILTKPVVHSFVLSNDPQVKSLDHGITAMPVGWFLGG